MNREFDSPNTEMLNHADDTSDSFDAAIPQKPEQIAVNSNRIVYKTSAGTTHIIALEGNNIYEMAIFQAFVAGFSSDWFTNLAEISKPMYYHEVRKLFEWLNISERKIHDDNRYTFLKDYEAFALNERNLKTSRIGYLNQIIREGLHSPLLSENDLRYLDKLLQLSKPEKSPEADPITLSEWLALPCLRAILGEKNYLQLESPRRLFVSFRVTISVTLLYLLEIRNKWQQYNSLTFDTNYRDWQYHWNPLLINHIGAFSSDGSPANDLSQLLWIDLVKPTHREYLKKNISLSNSRNSRFQKSYIKQGRQRTPWQKPILFQPVYQSSYSNLEEQLLAWLAACETIQPFDIKNLKTTDYAQEINASGRLIAMECNYFKGRAGKTKRPNILMGSDPWTQALFLYISGLLPSSPLFKTQIDNAINLPSLGKNSGKNGLFRILIEIWEIPILQRRIHAALKKSQATSIFLRAMLAIGNNYSDNTKSAGKSTTSIGHKIPHTIISPPNHIYSLTHIKNTAVHAGSDAYRESDLINHHSHTSKTEKHYYLTDSNKDFVNRAGRITRLVLHDLHNVVYQPSISSIQREVNDLELRTRITNATGIEDTSVHQLNQSIDHEADGSEIIIPDTSDNALIFIHYISEAERQLGRLVAARPDWVERTLIVQIEWMTRILSKMRSANSARSIYSNLCAHLPPMFDHILETME